MKILFSTLGLSALTWLGLAPQVEARPHRTAVFISGYQRCGIPIYSERYIVRYSNRVPVWGVRPCPPPVRYCPPVVIAPCPPPVVYCPPRPVPCFAPGVVFQATFTQRYPNPVPAPPTDRYDYRGSK